MIRSARLIDPDSGLMYGPRMAAALRSTAVRATDPEALALAEGLVIPPRRLRAIVRELAAIGSCELGFRTPGTPEDRATAEYAAAALRDVGLDACAVEQVRVDGWRLSGAKVEVAGGRAYEASAMGGVPGTPTGGITAELVDVGRGDRRRLHGLDVAGRIALVDWDLLGYHPRHAGLELGLRGVRGMIVNCPPGGPYYQAPNALGTFHSAWHDGAPPFVMIRKEDAARLRRSLGRAPQTVTLTPDAALQRDAVGFNSIGYLGGGDPRRPIVIGAHHDCWNRGAWDNTTGVAALIVLAEALQRAGIEPRHRLAFTSRTGEEYGMVGSDFDWCVGAWEQIARTHPEWGARSPFHLCLEASGHPRMRTIMLTPPELRRWSRAACRTAEAKGWLTTGWYSSAPSTGTEQWPFMLRGVPGISVFNWETWFRKAEYHTTFDTISRLDFDHLARMTRFFAYLLLMADRDPDGILDHRAGAREVLRTTRDCGVPTAGLERAAARHAAQRGRAAYTRVGRELCAVDADGNTAYPHAQLAKDLRALERARAALAEGRLRRAATLLTRVGDNGVAPFLGREAYAIHRRRRLADQRSPHWIGASHPTSTPDLWEEIAALGGDPEPRPPAPWIRRSLDRHIARTRRSPLSESSRFSNTVSAS